MDKYIDTFEVKKKDGSSDVFPIRDRETYNLLKDSNIIIYSSNELYAHEVNVNYDLTDYLGVLVTYLDSDGWDITHSVFVRKNSTNKIGGFTSPQFGSNIYRTVTVDNTGVTISTSSADDFKNAFIVPLSIIAIKSYI